MSEPAQTCPICQKVIEAMEAELATLRHDRDQWRASHDQQVLRCALLRQREDLPVDRIPAYSELVRLQALLGPRSMRDMDIALAVREWYRVNFPKRPCFLEWRDLQAIIAGVKTDDRGQ